MPFLFAGCLSLCAAVIPAEYRSPSGFGLVLPEGFTPQPDLPLGETGAAAPAPPGVRTRVEAVFERRGGEGVSSLVLSIVEAPLDQGTGAPERLCALAMAFVKDQLDSELRLDWVDHVPAAGGKVIELAGRFNLLGEDRVAQFAFVPMASRHLVVMASVPQAGFATLGNLIEGSLSTLKISRQRAPAGVAGASWSAGGAGASIGAAAGIAFVIARAWRRKVARRSPPAHS
jgi:hypothetical protein